ncbi:MAG: glycoside hydrolase family 2 TIM barrel-domain containing protein [Chthonomonadales bacterium]
MQVALFFASIFLTVAAAVAAGASPRIEANFDDGWRFHRGDVPDAWQTLYDDRHWRKVTLPHDFSIEDLPPSAGASAPSLAVVPGDWRFHSGDNLQWKNPSVPDAEWKVVHLPAHWSDHGDQATHAFGWYRRRIQVPASMLGKPVLLLIGKIDDADETFVNGVKVGGMGSFPPAYSSAWQMPRRYVIPANVLKGDGRDVVAIRVYNGEGEGGIYEAAHPPLRSGPFDLDAEGGSAQGYTMGAVAWYRKSFTMPASYRNRLVELAFDGIYMDAQLWLNGEPIARHPYGYTPFHVNLTPYLHFGSERNVLAVRVDTSGRTSRWYSGSGIYRHVRLVITHPVHIPQNGVFVTTPQADREAALVRIQTRIRNGSAASVSLTVRAQIGSAGGAPVGEASVGLTLPPGEERTTEQLVRLPQPRLWSPDDPALYHLEVQVTDGQHPLDQVATHFGVRTVHVDAVHGFVLNGRALKLRGGCIHHDNGCLGSCAYDRAEERRVQLLKAAGFNALRTSHNPPSQAFLDACDREGMLVMDEAFDCWAHGKNPDDYGRFFNDWWKQDLAAMILRDRNHPCVVLWSIGNEIPEQTSPEGAERAETLAAFVRSLDATRPVTQAAYPVDDTAKLDGLFRRLDVCGYNYMPGSYVPDHERHPQRVMVGTESFPQACFDAVTQAQDHPWVIGDFVWTAMDYLGEAGIGRVVPQNPPEGWVEKPYTVSNCGDLDLCGFRRPPSYYREVVWGLRRMVACFVEALGPDGKPQRVQGWGWPDERPSWTWPGLEGKPLTVRVYSSCPQVRLLLNGRDLGTRATTRRERFTAEWQVPYEPGELVAVGMDERAAELCRWELRTASKTTRIRLRADRQLLFADGQDLSYVTVEVTDDHGVVDPNAQNMIRFTIGGPGTIAGVGNGDPQSLESFQRHQRRAFRGRCLVVVKAGTRPGEIVLKANSAGLDGAQIRLDARPRP